MIEIHQVKKQFGSNKVLRGIDLTIQDGEVVAVIGSSGSGKSTLIRCLNGLERPTSGQIVIDGTDITHPKANMQQLRRQIGMVFQQFNLFPHLTVLANITLPLTKVHHMSEARARRRAYAALKRVGLGQKANDYPGHLSGGQKQRVAIARVLATQPRIILFDEPTSALDPEMVGDVLAIIKDIAETGSVLGRGQPSPTMIIVTHEMNFARQVASRLLFLDQGTIVADGVPEEVIRTSTHPKVRAFFDTK